MLCDKPIVLNAIEVLAYLGWCPMRKVGTSQRGHLGSLVQQLAGNYQWKGLCIDVTLLRRVRCKIREEKVTHLQAMHSTSTYTHNRHIYTRLHGLYLIDCFTRVLQVAKQSVHVFSSTLDTDTLIGEMVSCP